MNQQDWAYKLANEILENLHKKDNFYPEWNFAENEQIVEAYAQALRQEREIGRLESNKAISWPNEIPDDRFLNIRDERGELVMMVEYDWLKQTMEDRKK